MTIRIVTGWSNPGGSTVAHINLVNAFNEGGIEAYLHGPHTWHLNKCKSGMLHGIPDNEEDIVLAHFLPLPKIHRKKVVLTCHETNLFPLKKINLDPFDWIHFVSKKQQEWHGVNKPYQIIPNVLSDLKPIPKNLTYPAGVIGSIDSHKNTALSIKRAIKDGHKLVLVYGNITDLDYFNKEVFKYVERGLAKIMGHCDDKQKMYDSIGVVYHSSLRETFNYVKAECELTGTGYNGLETSESGSVYLGKDEIVNKWVELLEL